MDLASLLREIPLFESMEDADLVLLGKKLTHKTFAEGDVIFAQGDEGDAMYLIEEGAVDIVAGTGTQCVTLASLFSGQYFGELSLLDGAPRSAMARALRPTSLLALERDDFADFVKRRPEAALSDHARDWRAHARDERAHDAHGVAQHRGGGRGEHFAGRPGRRQGGGVRWFVAVHLHLRRVHGRVDDVELGGGRARLRPAAVHVPEFCSSRRSPRSRRP